MKPTTNPAAKVRESDSDSKLVEHELEQRERGEGVSGCGNDKGIPD